MYIVTTQQGDEVPLLVCCVSPKGADVRSAGDTVPCRGAGPRIWGMQKRVPLISPSSPPQAAKKKKDIQSYLIWLIIVITKKHPAQRLTGGRSMYRWKWLGLNSIVY